MNPQEIYDALQSDQSPLRLDLVRDAENFTVALFVAYGDCYLCEKCLAECGIEPVEYRPSVDFFRRANTLR
jgi:predicted metal-binding protein